MSKPELKPCPFCGGKAKLMQSLTGFSVECLGCGIATPKAPTSMTQYDPVDVVVVTWNRRSTDLNPAEIEELKSKYESAYKEIHMLYDAVGELQKERDAAVLDLSLYAGCQACAFVQSFISDEPCKSCYFGGGENSEDKHWQWRGVQEETDGN